ncbi:MAG: ATP-binding cassette domain-containing protein [Pseudomonadales bacterium]
MVELENITKVYRMGKLEIPALRGVNLTIGQGEMLAIIGASGSGKSTLAGLIELAASILGLRAANLSLDDFYLTRAEREHLARTVHPLLVTRGVPGTHDVGLACQVIEGLKSGIDQRCPRFDKARDDRRLSSNQEDEEDQYRVIVAPIDVVIFEGWCVGAPAMKEESLATPLNELERNEDADARWRRFVNDQLEVHYPPLWELIDELLFLDVPSISAVVRWRGEQESHYSPAARMNSEELARFVAHYERITLAMKATMSEVADMIGFLDENHNLRDLVCRNPRR